MEKWMFFLLIYYDKKKHRVKYFLLTIFRRASPIGTRSFFLILIFSRFFKNTLFSESLSILIVYFSNIQVEIDKNRRD